MIIGNYITQRRRGPAAKLLALAEPQRKRRISMKENDISSIIVDTAVYIHKNLGSGLLENVYEVILAKLLAKKGLHVQRQVSIPIEFEGELAA